MIGPNGSGKSTLVRILATTLVPDSGTVTIDGRDAVANPARARAAIGLCLADERSWYWQLSGRKNLIFFARLSGMSRAEASAQADAMLSRFDLMSKADEPFGTYSTGMKLRLSLARALIHNPPVLLLDEPTRSLDPQARDDFRDRIRGLVAQEHTVLEVTHDLHDAAEADVVYALNRGQIADVVRGGSGVERLAAMLAASGSE